MTDLADAIERFEQEARYPGEADDDVAAMEIAGRHLGVFVRELVRDATGRSNLDVFYPKGLTEIAFETHAEDLIHGLCDACGFRTSCARLRLRL